jgi:SAM-dependent methyltransferase
VLRDAGLLPLTYRRVLEVGCGSGGVLRDPIRYGAQAEDLQGVDILSERVERARELTPDQPGEPRRAAPAALRRKAAVSRTRHRLSGRYARAAAGTRTDQAPGGFFACTALETLPFLRSHFLAAIQA